MPETIQFTLERVIIGVFKKENLRFIFLLVVVTQLCLACTPTVKVEAPDKPIEINLNVKIEHEIRVKVDEELDELFEEDSTLF